MKITSHIGRWLGIAAIVIMAMAGAYVLGAFQAENGKTASESNQTQTTMPSVLSPSSSPSTPTGWKTFSYDSTSGTTLPKGYSWQTLSHGLPAIHYTFQYPPDWTKQSSYDTGADFGLVYLYSPVTPGTQVPTEIKVSVEPLSDGSNNNCRQLISTWIHSGFENVHCDKTTLPAGVSIRVSGTVANLGGMGGGLIQTLYLREANLMYVITLGQPKGDQYEKIFDEVASTLRPGS